MSRRRSVGAMIACCAVMAACVGCGGGQQQNPVKAVRNSANLRAIGQKQDFSADYLPASRVSDVKYAPSDPLVPYSNLGADVFIGKHPTREEYAFALKPKLKQDHPRPRNFRGKPDTDMTDWNAIVGGHYHCGPAAAAMLLRYWADQRGQGGLIAAGTADKALMSDLAEAMDTNDQNASLNAGDERGHFGSGVEDLRSALAQKAAGAGGAITVGAQQFNFAKLQLLIDHDKPVILFFQNPDNALGHFVLAYAYRAAPGEVEYLDPWDQTTKWQATAAMQPGNLTTGLEKKGGIDDVPVPLDPSLASGAWEEVLMLWYDDGVSP